MLSVSLQLPLNWFPGTSAITWTSPVVRSSLFNWPRDSSKKARNRPSGDQNACCASLPPTGTAVPATGCEVEESRCRMNSWAPVAPCIW